MKPQWFFYFYFFIGLLAIVNVSAAEIDISLVHDTYYTGENIQATVIINKEPINGFMIGKVALYNEKGDKIMSLLSLKGEDRYVVYGKAGNAGNYSLGAKGLKYEDKGILQEKDFLVPLTVETAETVTITPFFLYNDEKEIVISAKNNGKKEKQVFLLLPQFLSAVRNPLQIPAHEERRFFLTILDHAFNTNISVVYLLEDSTVNMTLNRSYLIPFITKEANEEENMTPKNETLVPEKKLVFLEHTELKKTFEKTKTLTGELKIKNEGMQLNFSVSVEGGIKGNIEMNQTSFSLANGEIATIALTVNKMKNMEARQYQGGLIINEVNLSFPVLFNVIEEKKQQPITINTTGEIFEEPEPQINISEYFDKDEKKPTKIGTGTITFILVVLLVGMFLVFFKILKKTVNPPQKGISDIIRK